MELRTKGHDDATMMTRCRRLANYRIAGLLLATCCVVYLFLAFSTPTLESFRAKEWTPSVPKCEVERTEEPKSSISQIECSLNGGSKVACLRKDEDVFVPFQSLLKQQYEVTGQWNDSESVFELSTTKVRVRLVPSGYKPTGAFAHFGGISVETRDRVRCVHPTLGVPMSTQWSGTPYFYPIQIAQFSLQHHARWLTEAPTKDRVIGSSRRDWHGSASLLGATERVFFEENGRAVVNVSAPDDLHHAGLYVYLDDAKAEDDGKRVVSFRWKPYDATASYSFMLRLWQRNLTVVLNYVFKEDDRCVWIQESGDESVVSSFSLGNHRGNISDSWNEVTRDVLVDASRALALLRRNNAAPTSNVNHSVVLKADDVKLVSLGFRGRCAVEQLVNLQAGPPHRKLLLQATDWLVDNQNAQGAWTVSVAHSLAGGRLHLKEGWLSAMAQGQAISALVRAHAATKEDRFIEAAKMALAPFQKTTEEGGVRADCFGEPWFEEYPTKPASLVLNGFMYALIGLYDLHVYANNSLAGELFRLGVNSLEKRAPLYDTGAGTTYDLRHVALETAPNLARWDYHAVHIQLIDWIGQIAERPNLREMAKRWIEYMHGQRAKHN